MLNQKMQNVAIAIREFIIRLFPTEYLLSVFAGKVSYEDVIIQTLVECSKYVYSCSAERKSLYHYLKVNEMTEGAGRENIRRNTKYIQKQLDEDVHFLTESYGANSLSVLESEKESEYHLTDLHYRLIAGLRDVRLVDAILKRKVDSKHFTLEKMKIYAEEYDQVYYNLVLQRKGSAEQVFDDGLVAELLEWVCNLNFIYMIVQEMERTGVSEIPDAKHRLKFFCGYQHFESAVSSFNPFPVHYTGDVCMTVARCKYVHDIVTAPICEETEHMFLMYRECLEIIGQVINRMKYDDTLLVQWLIKNTIDDDWASVFKEYDSSQMFAPERKWSDKKSLSQVRCILRNISLY
ncbi:MAG: hypothetical protein LUI87_00295 [Lachnospiraceae bacterium]|nr:hypothetical protein [Lachnospiraceae bacterium]